MSNDDNKGIFKEDRFSPKVFYERFNPVGQENLGNNFVLAKQIGKGFSQYIYRKWVAFIEAKRSFMEGDESFREVYEKLNNNGEHAYGYINMTRMLYEIVRLNELYLNEINFKKLVEDKDSYSCFREFENFNEFNDSKEIKKLINQLRNSIAHDKCSITIKDNKPIFVFCIGENNSTEIKVSLKGMEWCINLIKKYINKDVKLVADKKDKEYAQKLYSKFFALKGKFDERDIQKEFMINSIYSHRIGPKSETIEEVNSKLNELMFENPDLPKEKVFDLLYSFIQDNYIKYDRDRGERIVKHEKKTALFLAEDRKRIYAEDVLELAQYVFSTSNYANITHDDDLPKKLRNFFDRRIDSEDLITKNNLRQKGNNTFRKSILLNIRASIFHDHVSIDPLGNIVFRINNESVKDTIKKLNCKNTEKAILKGEIEEQGKRVIELTGSFEEKIYAYRKYYKLDPKAFVIIARFTPEEVLELCRLIMQEKGEKGIQESFGKTNGKKRKPSEPWKNHKKHNKGSKMAKRVQSYDENYIEDFEAEKIAQMQDDFDESYFRRHTKDKEDQNYENE